MKTFMAQWAADAGMYGLYSEATAVHPYSQRGNLHLGARETGFLLGYIPASVSYKQIGDERADRRGSVALFYMRVRDEPEREIYPPAPYLEAVRRVVEHNGLRRVIGEVPDPTLQPSRLSVEVRQDHNLAFLRVEEPGADLEELVHKHLRDLSLHRVDCVYVDLPLSHPATQRSAAGLNNLGVFFGGIIPEAHVGGGDVLRLQYLNNVEIEAGDVSTASDFGEELLGLIFRQHASVSSQAGSGDREVQLAGDLDAPLYGSRHRTAIGVDSSTLSMVSRSLSSAVRWKVCLMRLMTSTLLSTSISPIVSAWRFSNDT